MSAQNKSRNKKSIIAFIAIIALLLLLAIIFYSCGKTNKPDKVQEQNPNPVQTTPKVNEFLPPEVVAAVAGNDFSMVITKSGELWSWGNGRYGILGHGSSEGSSNPIKVMEGVKSVSTGQSHVIAVKEDGTLWTWGNNDYGQLGYLPEGNASPPKQILTDIKSAAAGWNFSLALRNDGSVYTWGDYYRENAFFTTDSKLQSPTEILQDVKKIAAGENFAFAIKNDDTLWAWGGNQNGQLTEGVSDMEIASGIYGQLKIQSKPIKIRDNVSDVAVGSRHVVVLDKDGSVWTWGNDMRGQLGINREGERWVLPASENWTIYSGTPKMILTDVTNIAACNQNSAAIKKDGSLWVWGSNALGQLGDGTSIDAHLPKKVSDNAATVSLGYNHMFVLKNDNTIWSAGSNRYGQLGDGYVSTVKKPVKVLDGVKQVAYSDGHTLAVKKDGTLWAWGKNSNGELGDGTRLNISEPKQIMKNVQQAAAGTFFSMGLKKDGTVWTWGSNAFGQQGNSVKEDVHKGFEDSSVLTAMKFNGVDMYEYYYKVYEPAQVMSGVADIKAQGGTAYALKKDNSMWGWGWNEQGELNNDAMQNTAEPLKIQDDVRFMAPSNMAVKKDGTLIYWGSKMEGLSTKRVFFQNEVSINGDIEAAYSDYFNFAVTSDGILWAWGEMLSNLAGGTPQDYKIPVQIGEGIRKAYNEGNNIYLIGKDNSLRIVHTSMFGDSIDIEDITPANDKLLRYGQESIIMNDVLDIALSMRNVFILKTDGTLWAFGNNDQGQLGDGMKHFVLKQIK